MLILVRDGDIRTLSEDQAGAQITMAKVDVLIPCYQYGRFLRSCVESVLTQDVDVRILIIDNASTDDSAEIAHALAHQYDRVTVRARVKNLGHTASFNEGVDWAEADYFAILSPDDMMAPGALRRSIAIMDAHPDVSFAHGRAVSIFPGQAAAAPPEAGQPVSWSIVDGREFVGGFCETGVNLLSQCATLVRTSVQKRAGYFRSELPHTDDFEMWMRLASYGPVAETAACQGISRIHGSNMSAYFHSAPTRNLGQTRLAFEFFFAHEGRRFPRSAEMADLARRRLSQRAWWSAMSHLLRGKPRMAWDLYCFAARLSPVTAAVPPLTYPLRTRLPQSLLAHMRVFRHGR